MQRVHEEIRTGKGLANSPASTRGGAKKIADVPDKDFEHGFCSKCSSWKGSLGLEPTPELYIQHIVQVFREIWRVLRSDGTVWLNLASSYAGGTRDYNSFRRDRAHVCVPRMEIAPGFKAKDLVPIPWMVTMALQADGWWFRRDIIWYKPNPMPESCTDRPTSSHEYIFILTKSGTPKFWTHRDQSGTRTKPKADYRWVNQISEIEVDAAPPDWKDIIICPRCEGTGIAMIDLSCEVMGQWMESWVKDKCPVCEGKKKVQKWKRINLWRGHDYFYDADAVKEGQVEYERCRRLREKRQGLNTVYNIASDGKTGQAPQSQSGSVRNTKRRQDLAELGTRNLRSVWTIATQPFPEAHFATFPEKLVEPCIKAGTSEKGCCPKCGAPWVRCVEKTFIPQEDVSLERGIKGAAGQKPMDKSSGWDGVARGSNESKTIGWRPSCECDVGYADPRNWPKIPSESFKLPIPCTVLDPFGGSGRTAIVAKKLGRKCISIELNENYCSMPLKELSQERMF